jgi:6-pyruvoyl-tetrahydropterin synthase
MRTTIKIKSNFFAYHRWKDAPEKVKFLREYHPHTFYIEFEMQVFGLDRDEEFFIVKERLDKFLFGIEYNHFEYSCETIAQNIIKHMKKKYEDRYYKVCVYEDGQNGGCVEE